MPPCIRRETTLLLPMKEKKKKTKTNENKKRYIRAEQVDVDKHVFSVVKMQLSGFEHDLTDSVGRRTQHHNYTHTHTHSCGKDPELSK